MARKKHTGRDLNGILLLEKPVGITSNKALQRAARLFNARKAGHTGSLDPLASGMLPICFGEATKMAGFLLDSDKAYTVTAQLGEVTNTGDADGEVITRVECVDVNLPMLETALSQFRGAIEQIPPMYSALKHNGQPLYKLARKGEEIKRKARCVTIKKLDLLHFDNNRFSLYVECTKGTYIRSLVADIGAVLHCGAHVTKLHRNWVQPFVDAPTYTFEQLEALLPGNRQSTEVSTTSELAIDALLLAEDTALTFSAVHLDVQQAQSLLMGQVVATALVQKPGLLYRVYGADQRFLGIGICASEARLAPKRLIRTH